MSENINPLKIHAQSMGVDPFMMTRSGVKIHYARLVTANIRLRDIASNLSYINRWVGSIGLFSVAQHSVLLAQHALDCDNSQLPPGLKERGINREAFAKALLLHDAEEYITNDIPGPLKLFFPLLKQYGDYLRTLIWRKYEVHQEWYPYCKIWDRRILYNEAEWGGIGREGVTPILGGGIVPSLDLHIRDRWSPNIAEQRFLDMYTRLV